MKPEEAIYEVFEKVRNTVRSPQVEKLLFMSPKAVNAVVMHAKHMVADTTELFFPSRTQREFAEALASEHLKEKASKAVEEIEIGQQTHLSTIEFTGRAALAEVAIEAEAAAVIPDSVTEEILEMAVDAEVDPDFEPLLDNESQGKLKEVFRRHNTVQDMFRYR